MAQSSGTMTMPVVGQQYCCPDSMDLVIVRKPKMCTRGYFEVKDSTGNIIFKVQGNPRSCHNRQVLFDAFGNPIMTLMMKPVGSIQRGQFRHERSHLHSKEEFQVDGSWFQQSCVIYAGESPTNIIASMEKKTSIKNALLWRDEYMVTVYPNIDYAFIVALIVIFHDFYHWD